MNSGNGFLLVNKPKGLTSFDVVRKARKVFGCKKTGHAGTLDPEAEGLLILAFGSATRLINLLPAEPKIYEFTIQFGIQTDSLDRAGVVEHTGGRIPEGEEIAAAVAGFCGPQLQSPPAFSALKVDGVRAYALARKGEAPVLAPRPITIYRFSMERFEPKEGIAHCTVACSGGTYVRAIARDVALQLGTYGFAASIRRTACGPFTLDAAVASDQLTPTLTLWSARRMFAGFPAYEADELLLERIATGRDVRLAGLSASSPPRQVLLFKNDDIVAVLVQAVGEMYHPTTVFITPDEVKRANS